MKSTVAGLVLIIVSAAQDANAVNEIRSPASRVGLMELYTSEGCSSCPPADRWLRTLTRDPRLWNEVIPLAFHVDYWDDLGWRDRFASQRFSDRQRRYRLEGGIETVYTPGFVVNGREWRGWFAGRPELPTASERPGVLALTVDGNAVAVRFEPTADPEPRLVAHVALLGFGLESSVRAGENRGSTLAHDFVVLGLASAPLEGGQGYKANLALPRTDQPADRYAVAAWVSANGRQQPLQAAGGFVDSVVPVVGSRRAPGYPVAEYRAETTVDE